MNPCAIPRPPEDVVGDGRWISMHNRFVQEAKISESEVVLIGDSIIQQMQFSTLWTEKMSSLHCVNFGIGGDRVENVLWRIKNGEFDFHSKIKAVVLFVGTNNTDCTPHEIFEGILEIIKEIKHILGNVIILIPTLLPRGQFPNAYRERNDHVNTLLIDKFSNEANKDEVTENVYVVKIHENIVGKDQTISHHVMHDYLHLTNNGYTKVFEKVYQELCMLLKIKPLK
ncbi:platelet-activating factor acetylhydrolase IB subunit alpha1-like isoform X1 [Anthonomus grandis grandis]|uniref:platelet-activating factor acetylhydrolase IB subunit alpha1-like isoform X1 n=1 Tax=Anthonomus grandis grandis TaxID=2921223 RepID=UPI00216579B6|nr:platelet-activating factor acetylhydrolase IB subunit alpha1-like isoform X1 [Anthonomus grandis grandis]XP_050300254.1 platelet-activating factor acetylhydrolase IB subunit alpha1-like isoform X1 [Anthonomus grandis grandis]XP_050300255.1 platelet-activating factor acetylhydrolase IB subunit alpha1-like isoform X1 [Anthonomus grandis grandis]XP_050300256.1 platelet-activating factor acetylhydrolase IB subunit alpha1-like isoform X1 [Anthonomus grandis grandis]XP_050300257.1 platelet-activat